MGCVEHCVCVRPAVVCVEHCVCVSDSHNMSDRPWHSDNDTAERNEKARKAYESLMTVTLRKPTSPEYRTFSNLVKKRAEKKYPNFTYGEDEVRTARVWGGRGAYSTGMGRTRCVQHGYGEDEVRTARV